MRSHSVTCHPAEVTFCHYPHQRCCLERHADCLHMVQLMPLPSQTPSSLASFKSSPVLPFWYQLTQVVLEKRPLNWCSSVEVIGHVSTECCCHILNVAEHASSWSYEQPHLYKSVETSTLTSISSSAFSRLFLSTWLRSVFFINSCNNIHNRGDSVAKWLACWTRAQNGPGSNRSRDAVG